MFRAIAEDVTALCCDHLTPNKMRTEEPDEVGDAVGDDDPATPAQELRIIVLEMGPHPVAFHREEADEGHGYGQERSSRVEDEALAILRRTDERVAMVGEVDGAERLLVLDSAPDPPRAARGAMPRGPWRSLFARARVAAADCCFQSFHGRRARSPTDEEPCEQRGAQHERQGDDESAAMAQNTEFETRS